MLRVISFGLLIALTGAASLAADTLDSAEAKRRGVPVEQVELEHERARVQEMQGQIEKLRVQLMEAQLDLEAAQKKTAQSAKELADLKAALTPEQQKTLDEKTAKQEEIKAAIARHEVVAGMTVTQVTESVGAPAKLVGGDAAGSKEYEWKVYSEEKYRVPGSPANYPIQSRSVLSYTLSATVEADVIVSFSKNGR